MSNDANALKRKEQIKKWLIYAGMGLLFLVSMYFIFKPSKEQVQAEQQKVGFNAELPDPRGAGIEADKIAAYELEDMRVKQEQKMRTLEDFTAMTTDDEEEEVVEIPEEPRYTGGGSSYRGGSSSRSNSFSTSTSAYNDIKRTQKVPFRTKKTQDIRQFMALGFASFLTCIVGIERLFRLDRRIYYELSVKNN